MKLIRLSYYGIIKQFWVKPVVKFTFFQKKVFSSSQRIYSKYWDKSCRGWTKFLNLFLTYVDLFPFNVKPEKETNLVFTFELQRKITLTLKVKVLTTSMQQKSFVRASNVGFVNGLGLVGKKFNNLFFNSWKNPLNWINWIRLIWTNKQQN